MRLHAIVDFMYLYYKYHNAYNKGRLRELSTEVDGENLDVTLIYYPLKEIEGIRKSLEDGGNEVIVSVCMDSKPIRKENDSDYKANRQSRLGDSDYEKVATIEQLLKDAGHNVFRVAGEEADDIAANLVGMYQRMFDMSIIYTPDSDLMIHIDKGVVVSRYKRGKYENVGLRNFRQYCSDEFKCNIQYNTLLMYKILCGDRTDTVKGVKGFGPKAFDKYMDWLEGKVDYSYLGSREACGDVILRSREYLGEDAVEQAIHALDLVGYRLINPELLAIREAASTQEERIYSYERLSMNSLF